MPTPPTSEQAPDLKDDAISGLVRRLARPHASGGKVIERAAILAEGTESTAVLSWIAAQKGVPEFAGAPAATGGGLHGDRRAAGTRVGDRVPLRYVLPPGTLG